MTKPTCGKCGAEVEPGTLLAHEKAMHPAAAATAAGPRRVCYRKGCVDVYGPRGHVVGLEGPHAY